MADFRLSSQAASDLADIADYTIATFGIEQARTYRDGLENCLQNLSDNPRLGRSMNRLAPELRRYEYQSHVVFYTPEREGVLVVRVLHRGMDHTEHL